MSAKWIILRISHNICACQDLTVTIIMLEAHNLCMLLLPVSNWNLIKTTYLKKFNFVLGALSFKVHIHQPLHRTKTWISNKEKPVNHSGINRQHIQTLFQNNFLVSRLSVTAFTQFSTAVIAIYVYCIYENLIITENWALLLCNASCYSRSIKEGRKKWFGESAEVLWATWADGRFSLCAWQWDWHWTMVTNVYEWRWKK